MNLSKSIKRKALDLGFDLIGITDASPIDAKQVELLTGWLNRGYAGRMSYMRRNLEKRAAPAKLLKNAQSVICLGLNYTPPKTQVKPPETAEPTGRIANYARYEDYHPFIKKQLRKLTTFISSLVGEGLQFRICVDSAPLAERALAARAGLGFIGKNHMLINPKLGPQILLGEIITNLKLQTDKQTFCHSEPIFCHSERSEESISSTTTKCSNCNRCIEACPTGALRPDGQFDANKCISYLTIEYKDHILTDLAEKIGDRLFGCDECIMACPYQKNAPMCKNKHLKLYNDRTKLNLQDILDMSKDYFEAKFIDSPIKRLTLQRLKRNARICLANTANKNT